MILISRIEEALCENRFPLKPPNSDRIVETIADMLLPFDTFHYEGATSAQQYWSGTRAPIFKTSPRRSIRPIPPPKKIVAPTEKIDAGYFDSIHAVWDFYVERKLDKPWMLEGGVTINELHRFLDPLWKILEPEWPLGNCLENLDDTYPSDCALYLDLPCIHFDEEHSGLVEAFCSGYKAVAGMFMHIDSDKSLELTTLDRELVDDVGFINLFKCYSEYQGTKTCDLVKLDNCYEEWFEEIDNRYPDHDIAGLPIVGEMVSMKIRKASDINCALEFTKAHHEMLNEMPRTWAIEDREDSDAEDFTVEVCEIWREVHK